MTPTKKLNLNEAREYQQLLETAIKKQDSALSGKKTGISQEVLKYRKKLMTNLTAIKLSLQAANMKRHGLFGLFGISNYALIFKLDGLKKYSVLLEIIPESQPVTLIKTEVNNSIKQIATKLDAFNLKTHVKVKVTDTTSVFLSQLKKA
jgi:hypothetical protein